MNSPGKGVWTYWLIAGAALLAPLFFSLADFVVLAREDSGSNPAQQWAYGLGNAFQVLFPLLCIWWADGRIPRPSRPRLRGVGLGIAFGLLVVAGTLVLYFGLLRDTTLFARTPAMLREKLGQFSLASPAGFAMFAVFITVLHSLLEEYYWRWFAFGWLRRRVALWPAIVLSSLAFMAHHVVVLQVWFPDHFWVGVVPFALCVAGGGAVWAWLFERTGSVYGPWASHLLVDAVMFVVGYDLFFVRSA